MFGPNANGEEPHWIIAVLFAIAILGAFIGLPAIAILKLANAGLL